MKILIIFLLFLTSCNEKRFFGYPKIAEIESKIKIGDHKSQVIKKIGDPSINESEITWYYVKVSGKNGLLREFVETKKAVVKISFNKENYVEKIENLS